MQEMELHPGSGRELLLTGTTGFLGKVVLHELMRRREALGVERVYALIRTNGSGSAEKRFAKDVATSACFAALPSNWQDYVEVIAGDLCKPGAGIDFAQRNTIEERVTHVINCAASVQFNLPLKDAAVANISTALEMLQLAKSCRRLESLVNVSTAYVTPHPKDGKTVFEELVALPWNAADTYDAILRGEANEQQLLAETGHPNTYTLTKCIAEHLLVERREDMPLTLVRPSIISVSMHQPFPGWIDSPAAFALFAAQIGSGRMRAVIGRKKSRLDVIPCDAVADRLIDAAFHSNVVNGNAATLNGNAATHIVHAVAGYDHSVSIANCADVIQGFFSQNPDTRSRNRDMPARIRYLGPDGSLYRFNHWFHHQRPSKSRSGAERIAQANEDRKSVV